MVSCVGIGGKGLELGGSGGVRGFFKGDMNLSVADSMGISGVRGSDKGWLASWNARNDQV